MVSQGGGISDEARGWPTTALHSAGHPALSSHLMFRGLYPFVA